MTEYYNFTKVLNGYTCHTVEGLYVGKSMREIIDQVEPETSGGYAPPVAHTTGSSFHYSHGNTVDTFKNSVEPLIRANRKIDAIKLVRNMYTTQMGLKEAKELVEYISELIQ